VNCLATLPSGDLVAGGRFATPALNIARWDGAAWWPLGSGVSGGENASVLALHVLPNGDLVACGTFEFAGGHPADRIARWDGARWSTLDTGLGGTPPNAFYPPSVLAVTALRSGEIVAGGSFTAAGGQTSAYWARWTETGSPWIARHPAPSTAHCPGQPAAFSVTPASGYGALTLRWQIESPQFPGTWLTLGSDPLPLPCGGSAWATQPASASTTIGVQPCAGMYAYRVRATVANECGSTSSEPAMLSVCYANCDCSSLPPVLSTGDLLCFLNRFASLDPYANCDGSTAPPALNVQDFLCFLNAFSAGCP
jgi:hypothetical protein